MIRAFNFVTLPLLTFYITREEMGLYQLLVGGMAIGVEVLTLGTRQYITIEYFKQRGWRSKLLLLRHNLEVYLYITAPLFFFLYLILSFQIDGTYLLLLGITVIQSYCNTFNELYLSVLQFEMRFKKYNLVSFLFGFLQVSFVLIAVVFLRLKLYGFIFGLVLAEFLQLAYTLKITWRYFPLLKKIKRSKSFDLSNILKNSIVFIPSMLSFWLLMNIDQWMLGTQAGLEEVGLYAFAGKFPLLFDFLLTSSFILVYTPFLYRKLKIHFVSGAIGNIQLSFAVLVMSIGCYYLAYRLSFLCEWLISPNFYAAIDLIPSMLFIACIRFATHTIHLSLKFKQHLFFIMLCNFIAAILNISLNYLWIPTYGIQGCLFATLVSFSLMYVISLLRLFAIIKTERNKEAVVRHAS
ncbi:MAG: hypothetical protein Tsb0021_04990 [Chlamydiales bacterium]